MGIDCRYCPLHKKDAFVTMTREELEFMQKFKVGTIFNFLCYLNYSLPHGKLDSFRI